jgi:hypothetical protein
VIATEVLGLVVTAVRERHASFEDVDKFVDSKLGGDAIAAVCVGAMRAFVEDPAEPVSLDIELPASLLPTPARVSLDELLSPPPPKPQPGSEWLGCFKYSTKFEQSLCLRKIISPP